MVAENVSTKCDSCFDNKFDSHMKFLEWGEKNIWWFDYTTPQLFNHIARGLGSWRFVCQFLHFFKFFFSHYKNNKLIWDHSEFAELKMKSLSQEEIKAYIKLDDPLQCCGCYKFESNGSDLFEYVKGSENVIKGLALEALLEALDKYN